MNLNCNRKTVFLDRDGTINTEKNYLYKIEDFEFIEGVPEAIARLKQQGYCVIVVTNQAGVARGYYKEEDVKKLHQYINSKLEKWGTKIDAFYYCPHHPTGGIGVYKKVCNCRKPETGLFEQACKEYSIDKKESWMIGDNQGDIEAGRKFGIKTIMVRTGYGKQLEQDGYQSYDYIADNLGCAVEYILRGAEDE